VTPAALGANLGGVALFAIPGLALAELFPPLARLPSWRRLGYAYLLGVAALAGALFAASHLFGLPLRRPVIAAAAMALAVPGVAARAWRWRRRALESAPPADPAPSRRARLLSALQERRSARRSSAARWRLAAGLVIVAVCLGTLSSALLVPLADWDGRMTWSALAAYMRQEGTVAPAVLRDARWFVVHPRYPPLLPIAQAVVQEAFGAGEDEELFRALYVGFLAALLVVIHDSATRAAGAAAATLATLCVALIPFLGSGPYGALSAYSDLPLAAFYGSALVWLLVARPSRASGLAAGIFLAGAVLVKNEGELLAAAALVLAVWRLLRRRPAAASPGPAWLAAAVLPALAAAALLASWRAGIPNRFDEDYFGDLRPSELVQGALWKLPLIAQEALRHTLRWSDWLGFWPLLAAVLLAGHRAFRRPLARRLALAGLAPPAIGWAAYAVSPAAAALISQTWLRFLIQALAPLATLFACALRPVLRQLSPPPGPRAPGNQRAPG
jgi:hypothetical protein